MTLFEKHVSLNKTFSRFNTYRWIELFDTVISIESTLHSSICSGAFTDVLVNTNIPEHIFIKCCGPFFKCICYQSIVNEQRLPLKLRNNIMYNKQHEGNKYNSFYVLKAASNNHLLELKCFPGGLDMWQYYNTWYDCELKDLSKHQWAYLDHDTILDRLRDMSPDEKMNKILVWNRQQLRKTPVVVPIQLF